MASGLLHVTSPPPPPSGPHDGRCCAIARRAELVAGPTAGTALLGGCESLRPLAFCRASPGGGRRAMVPETQHLSGQVVQGPQERGPGASALASAARHARGGAGMAGVPGRLQVFHWRLCVAPRERTAAIITGNKEDLGSQPGYLLQCVISCRSHFASGPQAPLTRNFFSLW